MFHCKDCHQSYFNEVKHKVNCVPNDFKCVVCNPKSPELQALEAEIFARSNEQGGIDSVEGVFGDGPWNKGFVDKVVNTGKGLETKFFGCSQLYKGKIRKDMIDSGAILKATLMETVKAVLDNKLLLILTSPILAIFWKRILKSAVYWFSMIYMKDLKQKTLTNINQFSPVTKELIRAGFKAAEQIPLEKKSLRYTLKVWDKIRLKESKKEMIVTGISKRGNLVIAKEGNPEDCCAIDGTDIDLILDNGVSFPYEGIWHEGEKNDEEYQVRVRRCIWAIATFIQADSAYYGRVQDGLNCIKEKSVRGLLEAFETVLKRERQIRGKVEQLSTLLRLVILFPPIRNLAIIYLRELDLSKFEPDDSDRYFAYRRSCYDFEGKSQEERMEWVREIDKRDNNVIIGNGL